ncbi:MAG: hypothetical protein H6724_11955 [Sandaracinus sp.]|nr:hypothetical protein [Sandaracinus sp.]
MPSWEREEIVTRQQTDGTGWLLVVAGGPPFAVSPNGKRRSLRHVDAMLPSPELRWAVDLTRADAQDLVPIRCLATNEVHGLVPRSAATYAWLGEDRLLASWHAHPSVSVLNVEGETLASFEGAGAPRIAPDARAFAFRRRGISVVVDAATLEAHELGRGDPQLALEASRVVLRDDEGVARVVDVTGGVITTLGPCDELALDVRQRVVGTLPVDGGHVIARWSEGVWRHMSRGPRDHRPRPSRDSHWIAFERATEHGPEVWVSSADVEWRVCAGSLLRWEDHFEQLPAHALLDFARRRTRDENLVLRTRARPREPEELEGLPRPDDARVATLLKKLADARERLEYALDAPIGHPRWDLHAEASRALGAARLELERATRAQLEAHRAHGEESVRAEIEGLLTGPERIVV